jgi:hypothetical protein
VNRVLLVSGEDLITRGISSLLQNTGSVNLFIVSIKNYSDLIREINDLRPDILVLRNSLEFASSTVMIPLLGKFPDLRILVIDESKNILHVYEKQEIRVTQTADFLGLVFKDDCLSRESLPL